MSPGPGLPGRTCPDCCSAWFTADLFLVDVCFVALDLCVYGQLLLLLFAYGILYSSKGLITPGKEPAACLVGIGCALLQART